MKSDESFEQDVRASLRAPATEPAPEELVSRMGRIPAGEPTASLVSGRWVTWQPPCADVVGPVASW